MLFSSYEFIFLFLPITFCVYFCLATRGLFFVSKCFLVIASLFFYSWWNIKYLPLILSSIGINYLIGKKINRRDTGDFLLLVMGILFDVFLLAYFKYADFFLKNINWAFNTELPLLNLALPLAISFFTFQQIAYLVDSYRGETQGYSFVDYCVFVTFFPQLIAGPIVHHKEMIPQFQEQKNTVIDCNNIAVGLIIFSIGLFKKVVLADKFGMWASSGFDQMTILTFFEAWATSLSYTFQLYFDFSGYVDMAIGSALFFNIKIPVNFNSPYKALTIQDFWRRWHITLSRFLRDYIYIPLGGNRKGELRTYCNLVITFLIGGIWHGAGWTFVFWGLLHGIAIVTHRFWSRLGFEMNSVVSWFITFNFVNISWVFFRAKSWSDAVKVLQGMVGMNGVVISDNMSLLLNYINPLGSFYTFVGGKINPDFTVITLESLVFAFVVTLCCKNTTDLLLAESETYKIYTPVYYSFLFLVSLLWMSLSQYTEFIYFNF